MLVVAVLVVIAAVTGWVWVPALLVGGALGGVLFCVIRTLARDGFHIAWFSGTDHIKWLECARCDGWGELLLQWDETRGTTVLNKVPAEERYAGKKMPGRYANAMNCPDCHGMGARWTGRHDGPVQLPLPHD